MTLISIKKIVKQVLQEEPPLASVGWANVNNKPVLFPPTAHGHAWNEISDKPIAFPPNAHSHQWNAIENKPSTFPPTAHAHDWSEVQNKPTTFSPSTHTHDWDAVENKPSTFPPLAHAHDWSEVQNKPATFNPSAHTHDWNAVENKPVAFPPAVHGHTWTDINNRPATFIIAIHADATANLTATNQPNSEQELGGSQRSRVLIDCTYLEQVRLTARIMAVSNSINNPRIYPQYSTDGGTVWNNIAGTDLILTGAINNRASAWINLPLLAKADVLWRVAINGGNAVADPAFGNIFLHFK